ncbi:sigma-70 family RNA polymerase sigma factor [Peribacillus kribbensis]|uniref:sigma-70 family RNA polymerase sigma factor n=1 Tax=Peribacillus kribbensis TaxID=356658 RepID=UPI000406EDCA|nr:sigma-70 family RNA polymerase sigma factor [Peribacillus kribbensis]
MKTVQDIGEKARELKSGFEVLIEEHRQGLWSYCRYLTGSPWDGEDLFQETFLKAMGAYYQRWHATDVRAYLYRIATNTWIDLCRRRKMALGVLQEHLEPDAEFEDNLELEYALECLTASFPPRQAAVFLLMEVFRFSAKEIAGMVRTTPGAVYASVRRMKEKLKNGNEGNDLLNPEISLSAEHKAVIQAYLKAFNEGNLAEMLSLFSDEPHYEASLGFLEYTREEMESGSLQHGLPGHMASEYLLWGRPVTVTLAEGPAGPMIHDIQYHEVENEKITASISYYFRKEFILAASEELGIPAQTEKFGW